MTNRQSTHRKKLVAPIVIAAVLILYYAGFAAVCVLVGGIPLIAKLLFLSFPCCWRGWLSMFWLNELKK